MELQLLGAVRDEHGRHEPGAVVSFDDDEARRLIRLGVAVEYVATEPQEAGAEPQEAEGKPKRRKRK
jgi:hypothetical protein